MTARIKLTVILALAALLFAVAGGVQAQEPPPDLDDPEVVEGIAAEIAQAGDREEALNQLSPAERQAVQKFVSERGNGRLEVTLETNFLPSEHEGFGQADSGAVNCATQKLIYVWEERIFFVNVDMFKFHSDTRWCWDGSRITSAPEIRIRGTVHWPGWEYVGNINQSSGGGKNQWEHWDYVQGHFRICDGSDCHTHKYPSITKRQYGDGTYIASATH